MIVLEIRVLQLSNGIFQQVKACNEFHAITTR